jgi:PAS domain S-box-containing protein
MSESIPPHRSRLDVLAGGGELGERMRAIDWSTTPLGPADEWPQSLKTCVRILLTCRQPMFVWWGDELINLYNDAYISILGGKHPEALGQPASEVWREIWDQVGPRAESAIRRNEGTFDESLLLIMERNGYPEETYYTFSYSPVPNDAGGTGGMICANTEDTARIIGERQLTLLRELATTAADVRTITDACPRAAASLASNPHDFPFALLYLPDPETGQAVLAGSCGIEPGHPAALAQISLAEGATWPVGAALRLHEPHLVSDLAARFPGLPTGAWDRAPHQAIVIPIGPSGQTGQAAALVAGLNPYRLYNDGYRGFLELVAAQIAAAIGNAQAYEAERQRAEALAELDRAKTAFFSNVSHEFRTPLTLMLGPLEDLLAKPAGDVIPANRELLTVVQRNGQRLLKLVNTLLDFSRIEAGRVQASYEPVDLAAYTAELASVFRAAVERAGMRLVIDCPPLPEPVYVDRDMWEKIVLNLVSNAFKYTLHGEIRVSLRAAAGAAILQVADTGIGIPDAELPNLFNRFHRVEGARGRTQEGTGIGLALVQELVRLHGGTVDVTSTPEAGSTFTVSLPTGSAHLPADQLGAARTLASTALGADSFVEEALRWIPDAETNSSLAISPGETLLPTVARTDEPRACILLVDDNADMRDYVRRLLSSTYEVLPVTDGEAALRAATEHQPDLVLTDVMMPKLDGFGLLKALRENPLTAAVPVIMLSARAGEEARVEGLQAGADDYLTKPFSARELLARVGGTLALARARREADAELRESEVRFRHMADNAPVMVWVTEADGACSFLSQSWYAFTGTTPETSLGFGWLNAVHPDDRPRAEADFIQANARREPFRAEYRLRRANGEYAWAIDAATPRIGPDGRFLGYIGSVIDINDRKQAEEALRVADRRKDEFLATLAHELRNPLAPVRNGLEIMRLATSNPAAIERARAMMERQIQQMTRLIEDLLDLSRISRGKIELRKQRLDVTAAIQHALETSRPLIEHAGHRLRVELPSTPIWAEADLTRLEQIFANLLNNAAKYTEPGGQITVILAPSAHGTAEIRVRDTGIGIPPDQLEQVFEMFSQVSRSQHRSGGGLGIGLNIVKQLVEMHGGSVHAESAGLDHGSEFVVELPLLTEVQDPSAAPGTASRAASGHHRVLVTDDNVDAADSMAMMLEIMGHEVEVAHDGLQALAAAPSFRPNVFLLDIGMPNLNGYDTCRRLREQPGGDRLHVIALTGWGQEEDKRRSREAGFDYHLVKPVEPAALQELLAGLPPTRVIATE